MEELCKQFVDTEYVAAHKAVGFAVGEGVFDVEGVHHAVLMVAHHHHRVAVGRYAFHAAIAMLRVVKTVVQTDPVTE